MKLTIVLFGVLLVAGFARDAGAVDPARPLHWGERETLYTTICEKRWHAVRVKALRNLAIDSGEGVLEQVRREKEAHFAGEARCFTGDVTHWPVANADIIDGVKTWTRVEDAEGPVPCFEGKRCRWEIHTLRFVESTIELGDGSGGGPVYVATERPIIPVPLTVTKAPKKTP